MPRSPFLAAILCLVAAAPAHAVIGGRAVRPADAPWFARVGLCGGELIAPDRVLTSGHCVQGIPISDLDAVKVGGVVRRGLRVAMYPDWRRRNGPNAPLDDIAIVALDQPVPGVKPAPLATARTRIPKRLKLIGSGVTQPDRRVEIGSLRQATLQTVGDRACARVWRRHRGNGDERFDAPRMLCAVDADGRRPLRSACYGDSGGAMYAGSLERPVLLGVTSWVGPGCGTDHLPSVGARVSHYRAFALNANPVWAPVTSGSATVSGDPRAGQTLTCTPPVWDVAPEQVQILWERPAKTIRRLGSGPTYVPRQSDVGEIVACHVVGTNAGGQGAAEPAPQSVVRIRP
jgi:Trypsin